MLRAGARRCASACATAESAYAAVASPIVAEDARVGVVILLVESSAAEERLIALQREISEPLGELRRCSTSCRIRPVDGATNASAR